MTASLWGVVLFLFAAGLLLVVLRRQLIAMLLGLELMISAANLALVYHAGLFCDAEVLAAVLLILAVAAAEAVVGLSLILRVYQSGRPVDAGRLQELRG
ncbi:MAG: NADH-quinone oxidoreductase subunit NuoK [Elusimicrobia bacterium]|nr:NADH-quinone oxidoreductase subunit NuoK [Elusimicrobiota bacterium]